MNDIKYCKNCKKDFQYGYGDFCSKHCLYAYNPVIIKTCPHCKQVFNIEMKKFSSHVKYCEHNPKRKQIINELQNSGLQTINKRFGLYKDYNVNCFVCNKQFIVNEREKTFPKKQRYFCCDECKQKYIHSFIKKEKISDSLSNYYQNKKEFKLHNIIKECPICKKHFKNKNKYCSKECSNKALSIQKISKLDRTKLEDYRKLCNFQFSIRDYPDEFNFDLIKQYGWYKPKNHGNNLHGVSRDHIYSIKEGFLNNVDPQILAHPANCQLLRQTDNSSKNCKSHITLQQLLEKIDIWNKKYNKLKLGQ